MLHESAMRNFLRFLNTHLNLPSQLISIAFFNKITNQINEKPRHHSKTAAHCYIHKILKSSELYLPRCLEPCGLVSSSFAVPTIICVRFRVIKETSSD